MAMPTPVNGMITDAVTQTFFLSHALFRRWRMLATPYRSRGYCTVEMTVRFGVCERDLSETRKNSFKLGANGIGAIGALNV